MRLYSCPIATTRCSTTIASRRISEHISHASSVARIAIDTGKYSKDRLTTVFPRQGHYALDPANIAAYPPADLTIQRIRDLVNADLAALLGNDAVGRA